MAPPVGAPGWRVSVGFIEYRRVEPSARTFAGTWDLARLDGRWVLHEPHF